MIEHTPNPDSTLDSLQAVPQQAAEFTRTMTGLLDGKPKDDATVAKAFEGMDGIFDLIAAGLYNMASMLVGEGEESIQIVEAAITNAEVTCCTTAETARKSGRRALARESLTRIAKHDPESLATPEGVEHAQVCIEDDDLDAAGVSREEFEKMIAGPNRGHVRTWLESLPTSTRAIFVLRAVAGIPAAETASLLAAYGGPKASGWTADSVREIYRQGLCSLASQLLHEGINS